MYFHVFGPLTVSDGEIDRTPTSAKQSQLLALLLLRAGRQVPTRQLVEELWDADPPRSAVSAVHTHIKELRRAIGRFASCLVTDGRGYRFDAAPEWIDLFEFHRLVRAGRAATRDGDVRRASSHLRAALSVGRRTMLADVELGPVLRPIVEQVQDVRSAAFEERIWAELQMGRHRDLVGELRGAVHRDPTRENSAAQLMVALCGAGRTPEALEHFHVLVKELRTELGLSPSGPLHQLYVDILERDPRLECPPRAVGEYVTNLRRMLVA